MSKGRGLGQQKILSEDLMYDEMKEKVEVTAQVSEAQGKRM